MRPARAALLGHGHRQAEATKVWSLAFLAKQLQKLNEGANMNKGTIIGASILILLNVAPAQSGPCTDAINSLSKMMASHDAGSGSTIGAASSQSSTTQPSSSAQQHPPTAIISKETEGRAASPQDVQRQTTGQPTAAEQPQQSTSTNQQAAAEALDRARLLDQQGNETECMAVVRPIKELFGLR
jgi:hypothetical protein